MKPMKTTPEKIVNISNFQKQKWDKIIIHHSGGMPVKDTAIINKRVDWWHRFKRKWFWQGKARVGWKFGMGYHIFIERNGEIYMSERWMKQLNGAHTIGQNDVAIGIALAGNFDKQFPTYQQINSLCQVINLLRERIRLKIDVHKTFQNKSCPGYNFPYGIL